VGAQVTALQAARRSPTPAVTVASATARIEEDFSGALFGLASGRQGLHHFTVGGAAEDARLTTLPAHGSGAGT